MLGKVNVWVYTYIYTSTNYNVCICNMQYKTNVQCLIYTNKEVGKCGIGVRVQWIQQRKMYAVGKMSHECQWMSYEWHMTTKIDYSLRIYIMGSLSFEKTRRFKIP